MNNIKLDQKDPNNNYNASNLKCKLYEKHFLDQLGFYHEDIFQKMLLLEQKRSERSKTSFILFLIELTDNAVANFTTEMKELHRLLSASVREIDIIGWYKYNNILGIIFTEMPETSITLIKAKVTANLTQAFGNKEILKNIITQFYPTSKTDEDILKKSKENNIPNKPLKNATFFYKIELLIKRSIDILWSLLAIILFAPVFIIIPILIKLSSNGPVFFKQNRVGKNGALFPLYRFRTMHINNENTIHQRFVRDLIKGKSDNKESTTQLFRLKNDPRILPIGSFLRKTSLDELPQFLNVLKGDMSLVGPRPAIPYEVDQYDEWHKMRFMEMKPGITGLWQVEGRSSTTFDQMVLMDIEYIRKWSIFLDLKLIIKTPISLFKAKGAY